MIAVLDEWDGRCVGVLEEIEDQVRDVRRNAAERRKRRVDGERALEVAMGEEEGREREKEREKEKGKAAGKRVAADGENVEAIDGQGVEEMELDEGLGRGGARNAKRGGGRFAGLGRRLG